jgi:hypothetical protein
VAEAVGWAATVVFSASYFFQRSSVLRRIQAVAACLWIAYGLATRAWPVVVANFLVATAAVFSLARDERPQSPERAGGAGTNLPSRM